MREEDVLLPGRAGLFGCAPMRSPFAGKEVLYTC